MYVRDLALELKSRGHEPIIYTCAVGTVAQELQDSGIFVTRDLRRVRTAPDLIHGHHWLATFRAVRHFSAVPAIYICHHHLSVEDRALIAPQIRRYFGVSQLCMTRLAKDGISPERIKPLYNFVDLRRFVARAAGLPVYPQRALVFSNYAQAETHLPAVQEACRQASIQLDVVGLSAGNPVSHPEKILGQYDLVFAKAKAAMEAMACGAAVILCDSSGVGPLVTSANFDRLRPMNFGFEALTEPLIPTAILRQIERYDRDDAVRVCARLRSTASLESAVTGLCDVYEEIISSTPVSAEVPSASRRTREMLAEAVEVTRLALTRRWMRMPVSVRRQMKRLPGAGWLIARVR